MSRKLNTDTLSTYVTVKFSGNVIPLSTLQHMSKHCYFPYDSLPSTDQNYMRSVYSVCQIQTQCHKPHTHLMSCTFSSATAFMFTVSVLKPNIEPQTHSSKDRARQRSTEETVLQIFLLALQIKSSLFYIAQVRWSCSSPFCEKCK